MLDQPSRLQRQQIAVNIAAVTGVIATLLMVIAPHHTRCLFITIPIRSLAPFRETETDLLLNIRLSFIRHRQSPGVFHSAKGHPSRCEDLGQRPD
jgi:hypothetical protein